MQQLTSRDSESNSTKLQSQTVAATMAIGATNESSPVLKLPYLNSAAALLSTPSIRKNGTDTVAIENPEAQRLSLTPLQLRSGRPAQESVSRNLKLPISPLAIDNSHTNLSPGTPPKSISIPQKVTASTASTVANFAATINSSVKGSGGALPGQATASATASNSSFNPALGENDSSRGSIIVPPRPTPPIEWRPASDLRPPFSLIEVVEARFPSLALHPAEAFIDCDAIDDPVDELRRTTSREPGVPPSNSALKTGPLFEAGPVASAAQPPQNRENRGDHRRASAPIAYPRRQFSLAANLSAVLSGNDSEGLSGSAGSSEAVQRPHHKLGAFALPRQQEFECRASRSPSRSPDRCGIISPHAAQSSHPQPFDRRRCSLREPQQQALPLPSQIHTQPPLVQPPQIHSRRASLRDAHNSLQESRRNSIRDARRGSLHDTKLDSVSVRESARSSTRDLRRGSSRREQPRLTASAQQQARGRDSALQSLREPLALQNSALFALFSSGGINGPPMNGPTPSGFGFSLKRVRSGTNTQGECPFSPRYLKFIHVIFSLEYQRKFQKREHQYSQSCEMCFSHIHPLKVLWY